MRAFQVAVFAAAMLLAASAEAKILITIDKSAQRMTVAVDGAPRWTWPVSTGRRGHDTPNGSFTAFRMEKDHFSKEWDDAPMPHSIFFTQRGHAIHGSYDTKRLGSAASHGCVRLNPANAAKLFALVQQQGVTNATVVIAGATPGPGGASPRRTAPTESDELPGAMQPFYRQAPSPYSRPSYEPPPGYYHEQRPAAPADYYRY
jgi:lipoprotein-anchoring transpeptidase ErfK/SrfK